MARVTRFVGSTLRIRWKARWIGPCPMATVDDTGPDDRATIALVRQLGMADSCNTVGIQFIEPPKP